VATFLLSQVFLGLSNSFLEFRETVHDLRERVGIFFLTAAVALLSNGCFSAETLLKSSIFLVFTALTGIVGCVRAPMLLAQRAAFLNSRLFGNLVIVGITTLALTFVALSGGFLSAFLCSLFLGVGICYYYFNVLKNAQ
jgi:type IV secretory pathway TrbL component